MHSENEIDTPTPTPSLRREVPIIERQRMTVLAGLLSLAGVALGFGLGQYASVGTASSHCEHRVVVQPAATAHPTVTSTHRYAQNARLTWLGVEVEGRRNVSGALIVVVVPNSPAERAGLKAGQRIITLGDAQISSAYDVVRQVRDHEPGNAISIVTTPGNGFDDSPPQIHNVVLGVISPHEMLKLQTR